MTASRGDQAAETSHNGPADQVRRRLVRARIGAPRSEEGPGKCATNPVPDARLMVHRSACRRIASVQALAQRNTSGAPDLRRDRLLLCTPEATRAARRADTVGDGVSFSGVLRDPI